MVLVLVVDIAVALDLGPVVQASVVAVQDQDHIVPYQPSFVRH